MTVYADIDARDDSRIAVQTEYRHKDLMQQIPGSAYKGDAWTLPLGWASCLALRGQFGDELQVGPALNEWSQTEYRERVYPSLMLRQALDADGPDTLYSYQRAGVKFLATARRALLADEMGTGKTRQAYHGMMELLERGENPFPALVVCPNSTKISWRREGEIVWPGLKITVVSGSAAMRRKQLEDPAHVYVMNWEQLRAHSRLAPFGSIALKKCVECGGTDPKVSTTTCEVHERELNRMEFRTVIADEAHRATQPQSKQTRALWAATGAANIRFALTGTPIANTPEDLWAILHWLSPNEWPSKTKYIDRMCELSFNAFGAATIIGIRPSMQTEFFAALDPRLRRMPKELVLPFLPPIVYERRDVAMTPKQQKAYDDMRDQMVAELESGDQLVTTDPRVKMIRLLQFASSYATIEIEQKWNKEKEVWEEEEHVRLADPSCKIDAFIDDLPDFGDQSLVVFAVSRQLVEMLSARLDKLHIKHGLITGAIGNDERQVHMDDFQAGRTRMILCTVGAGGTGITLTRGGTAVYLQRSWSMIDNNQSEARVHRIGSEQHSQINIIDYVATDTVEEIVFSAIQRKTNSLEQVLRDTELLIRTLGASSKKTKRGQKKEAA